MRIELNGLTGEAVVKRAFFLAWIACGRPMGMGILRDRPNSTEEDVWRNVQESGDYDFRRGSSGDPGCAYGDYVFGRMMKLTLRYGADWVEFADSTPRPDYQSWCIKYPSYRALIDEAIAGLKQAA